MGLEASMSHEVTVEVSDSAFDAIQTAAEAVGATPAEIVAATVERQFSRPPRGKGDFRKWFGSMTGEGPLGLDNEQIDADLAREYGNDHETP
jgi:hypothetical protein